MKVEYRLVTLGRTVEGGEESLDGYMVYAVTFGIEKDGEGVHTHCPLLSLRGERGRCGGGRGMGKVLSLGRS